MSDCGVREATDLEHPIGNIRPALVDDNLILFNLIGRTMDGTPAQLALYSLTLRDNFIPGMHGLSSERAVISYIKG